MWDSRIPPFSQTRDHRYGTDGGSFIMYVHFRVSCESVSGLFRKRLACLPGTCSSTFIWRTMQLQLTPFVRPNVADHFWALQTTILSSAGEIQSSHSVINQECGRKTICDIAEGSFDPPTLGLWAQCASSAPFRCLIIGREKEIYTQSILLHWERSNMNLWIKKYLCRELMTEIIILKKRCQNSRRQPRTKILHWLAMHFSDDFRTTQW